MNDDEIFSGPEEELELDLVITVREGEVVSVKYMGNEVRALVHDYDVTFPCVASGIGMDDEGQYFKAIIV